jgi:hypothetical protein
VDFPSVQLARQVIGLVVTRPEFYGVAAMSTGELVGSNFLTVVDEVAGVGPIMVDPANRCGCPGFRLPCLHHFNHRRCSQLKQGAPSESRGGATTKIFDGNEKSGQAVTD